MNLRKIRLEKGLSVAELSRLSGVPVRTIEDLEKEGTAGCQPLLSSLMPFQSLLISCADLNGLHFSYNLLLISALL